MSPLEVNLVKGPGKWIVSGLHASGVAIIQGCHSACRCFTEIVFDAIRLWVPQVPSLGPTEIIFGAIRLWVPPM